MFFLYKLFHKIEIKNPNITGTHTCMWLGYIQDTCVQTPHITTKQKFVLKHKESAHVRLCLQRRHHHHHERWSKRILHWPQRIPMQQRTAWVQSLWPAASQDGVYTMCRTQSPRGRSRIPFFPVLAVLWKSGITGSGFTCKRNASQTRAALSSAIAQISMCSTDENILPQGYYRAQGQQWFIVWRVKWLVCKSSAIFIIMN